MATDHRARLAEIKHFNQLLKYLRDELGWPIEKDDFEDLTFDYTAEELGIDSRNAAKIQDIKRLRPLSAKQPWGIFFVKFEPKRLPIVALRRILGQVTLKKRTSASEAERTVWSMDDLLFISNYSEGEERQITFAHFSIRAVGSGLPSLKVLGWDNQDTPLHLDQVAKELVEHLSWPADEGDLEAWRRQWGSAFTIGHREVISTAKELSLRLASLARAIRDRILGTLAIETEHGKLTKLMKAFQASLVHDLKPAGFADMYAQTIAYGLLSARISDPDSKTADDFAGHLRTNPFLRDLMETFVKVGGAKGKGGAVIDFDELGVGEVVELLDSPDTHMDAVLADFGDRNPQEDPVIYFYVDFLEAYDKKQKVSRGVFYTPRPVVSYIVRSVDELLRSEFGLVDGLADCATWGEMAKRNKELTIPEGVSPDQGFVQILDPATGTGTFLVEIIDTIHNTLLAKWKGKSAKEIDQLWNEYVPSQLLPRLHGYELLMAPYAIAHLKVGLKLHETGYRFESEERARIFLTNALEPASDLGQMHLEGMLPALAHEAKAVNEVKRKRRFTVVVGNPPYSNFGQMNKIVFIQDLLELYKRGLNERKINLDDDYIKFIRYAHSLIETTRCGVIGFITNDSYLGGLTHRQMRKQLLLSFDAISITELHGSAVKVEPSPKGKSNENVFDIKQGVAIILLQKSIIQREVGCLRHSDIWGKRSEKYAELERMSANRIASDLLLTNSPTSMFVPMNLDLEEEYRLYFSIAEIMPVGTSAIQTKRDALFIDFERKTLAARMADVIGQPVTQSLLSKYPIEDSAGWTAQRLLPAKYKDSCIVEYQYRPFDYRYIYYDEKLLGRSRYKVLKNLLHPNIVLATLRQTIDDGFRHVFCSRAICDINLTISHHVSDQVFPLFVYSDNIGAGDRTVSKITNIALGFWNSIIAAIKKEDIDSESSEDTVQSVFSFIYSILHSPTYRTRYAEFLKIDFPRIPLPGSLPLFSELAALGDELVAFHLLESPKVDDFITEYTGQREPEIEKVSWSDGTVWVDKAKSIGFKGVREEVWNFHIGGYQVCEKWLKDRKRRKLLEEDLRHYQRVVVALSETIRLMAEIDLVIERHGGWPGAFHTEEAVLGASAKNEELFAAEEQPEYPVKKSESGE